MHGMSGVISDHVLDEAKRQHAISIVKTDLMEMLEPIFAFTHIGAGIISTVAHDRISERYQISYRDDVAGSKDIIVDGEVFKDQPIIAQRTYYVGGKGLERFASGLPVVFQSA
jgi:hypothetical protein